MVVDCTAGADSFASGLFTRFDLTVLAAEPTRKGISVYRQWQGYATGYDVVAALAGNKAQTDEDAAFLRSQAGGDLVTWLGYEPAIRAMEQGRPFSMADLSDGTSTALGVLREALDTWHRDWARYTRQAAEFHVRNARAWASAAAGEDLAAQVDPDFTSARPPSGCPPPERPGVGGEAPGRPDGIPGGPRAIEGVTGLSNGQRNPARPHPTNAPTRLGCTISLDRRKGAVCKTVGPVCCPVQDL